MTPSSEPPGTKLKFFILVALSEAIQLALAETKAAEQTAVHTALPPPRGLVALKGKVRDSLRRILPTAGLISR
jgi:hypothetical protein